MRKRDASLPRTYRNLLRAFRGEVDAIGHYTAYGHQALAEGYPEIAQVFFEAAGAETAHAISHLKAMGAVRSTLENLNAAARGEGYEIEKMYPQMIKEAQEEGLGQAAESFQVAWEREKQHQEMFREALAALEAKLAARARVAPPPSSYNPSPPAAETLVAREQLVLADMRREKERVGGLSQIRQVVFGAQDGLIATVALLAGVYAATGQNTFVLVAGLAEAVAGMLSMAAGSYLSSKAERQVYEAEIDQERKEIEEHPEEEIEELRVILKAQGLTDRDATALAHKIASKKDLLLETLVAKELGLPPEVLPSPLKDAFFMGLSFLLGAALPILPYLFVAGAAALGASVGVTVAALFGIGVGKALLARRHPLFSGLEMMAIGGGAGLVGYLVGTVLPKMLGLEG